ncbi:hypothetical protein MPS_2952 [Mycobacterium pseudoshottsii JCM 15466]|nr:hypothetical protein MPS_2952 [Mycobacterium pseudoshottsii JCM 15466]
MPLHPAKRWETNPNRRDVTRAHRPIGTTWGWAANRWHGIATAHPKLRNRAAHHRTGYGRHPVESAHSHARR